MAKVTSKLQVSIPRSFADQLEIEPGDEIDWSMIGKELRISTAKSRSPLPLAKRLDLFDAATKRQAVRNRKASLDSNTANRGWKREDLYDRGRRSR